MKPNVVIRKVSPIEAHQLLMKNECNRPIKASVVEKYRQAMVKGDWLMNGESIKFDETGNLIDGQHRLTAISKQDSDIEVMIVMDLETPAKYTIDQGKRRTNSDAVAIAGYTNADRLTRAAIRMLAYEADKTSGEPFRRVGGAGYKVNNATLIKFLEENGEYIDKVVDVAMNLQGIYKGLNFGQYVAVIHAYVSAGYPNQDIVDTLTRFAKGENLLSNDLLMIWRKKMQEWYMNNQYTTGMMYRNNLFNALNCHLDADAEAYAVKANTVIYPHREYANGNYPKLKKN